MENTFKGITDPFVLKNGVRIPCVGLGTFKLTNDAEGVQVIESAIVDCGYRHIDTAAAYKNEASVGKAVKASGVPREKLFVTTKVWNVDRGYSQARQAFDLSLERLGLDYVDIVVLINEHFGFKIRQEELKGVNTFAKFCDYIESKVN